MSQVVDPAVSHAKFDQEVAAYRASAALHQRRGWFLVEAEFPKVFVVLAAPQLTPSPIVTGVEIDFTNYDLWPPSVVLVNPFTRDPYHAGGLPTALLRRRTHRVEVAPGQFAERSDIVPLMQAHTPDEVPFLCVPGVREYHEHPAHTGDSWLGRRGDGEGTLFAILNTIHQYGSQPITQYQLGLQIMGFAVEEPPL